MGHPSFVMSASFINQTLAQIELFANNKDGKHKKEVIAGLDPAIHLTKMMDTRVKPAYDTCG